MVEVYIVRHGETLHNANRLIQGWCDSPLTPKGESQARALGREMRHIPFCAAYAGDLGRQQRTAEIILKENVASGGIDLSIDPRFREIGFGSFEGKEQKILFTKLGRMLSVQGERFEDMAEHFTQKEISGYVAKLDPDCPPETGESCCERFMEGLLDAAAEAEKESGRDGISEILLVSSGAAMGMLMETLDPEGRFSHIMGNTDVIIVEIDG